MSEREYVTEWAAARNALEDALAALGHPVELGDPMARQLGSPKAIRRMTAYLYQAKPRSVEEVVDEMLAIYSEIEEWRDRKESQEANSRYNEYLNRERDED